MKRLLFAIIIVSILAFAGCEKGEEAVKTDPIKEELFHITDKYVSWLDTMYESFGINGNKTEKTSDGTYQVAGIGRLIIVKITKYVPDSEYEKLKRELGDRYDDDHRVNDVFVNDGGTITIDCRN
jgi:hypothetical protein